MRALQAIAVRIEARRAAQITAVADENVVKPFIRSVSVSGFRQIHPWRSDSERSRYWLFLSEPGHRGSMSDWRGSVRGLAALPHFDAVFVC
jgi:hypothetical protein